MFGIDDLALGALGGELFGGILGSAGVELGFGAAAGELAGLGAGGALFDGIPSWLTGMAGPALGAGMGMYSAQQTNEFNREEAEKARHWQASRHDIAMTNEQIEAQKARDWSERMSGTAITRRIQDLKNAGLNPMLAYSQGAETPSAAMGKGHSGGGATASAAGIPSIAGSQIATSAAQIRNMDIQNELLRAQVEKTNAETVQTYSSAGHLDAQRDNLRQEMTNFPERVRNLLARTANVDENTLRQFSERQLNDFALRHLKPAELDKIQAQANKLYYEAMHLNLKVPESVAEYRFFGGPDSKTAIYFRHAPKNLTSAFTGSIGAALDDLRPGRHQPHAGQFSSGRIRYGR